MEKIISVDHLAYTYPSMDDTPGVKVFEDLNLQVEKGSFVAVLGGNGCGKSTLAKHFNSILLPSGGKSVASTSKSYERAINRAIEQLEKALTKFED